MEAKIKLQADQIAMICAHNRKEFKERLTLYKKRVSKGIQFLDKEVGRKKWLRKIKLSILDISELGTCVCGQAFEDGYSNAVDILREKDTSSNYPQTGYGFSLAGEDGDYDLLTAVWYDAIKKLKSKK